MYASCAWSVDVGGLTELPPGGGGNRRVWLRETERERIGREIWEDKPRGWVFSIWLMPRMRVHMWRTAVSDSCPAQLLPSTFDRTHIYSWREMREGEKGLFSPLTLGYAPELPVTLTLQHRRARYSVPNTWRVRRVLTGITAMMWYHSQPWPDHYPSRLPRNASRRRARF